jgi:hypothetical protein
MRDSRPIAIAIFVPSALSTLLVLQRTNGDCLKNITVPRIVSNAFRVVLGGDHRQIPPEVPGGHTLTSECATLSDTTTQLGPGSG